MGVPAHFSILWLCWPSRMQIYGFVGPQLEGCEIELFWPSSMQIYGFVEDHTFLKQFLRMGVPAQFSNLGVPAQFSNLGVPAQFSQPCMAPSG